MTTTSNPADPGPGAAGALTRAALQATQCKGTT